MGLKQYVPPTLVLLLLSPAIGEVLSGSSPPLELLNPVGVTFLIFLYGGGAIMVREIALRWKKGWPSILLLGAAYGIVEEGLMVKSFFNPSWMDIGVLGSYGRWLGVNWVWSLQLTIFHAVFSITIPRLLVTLAYPDKSAEPWAGKKMLLALAVLFVADVVIGYFLLAPYPVPLPLYILSMICVVILALIAWKLPYPLFRPKDVKTPKPRWLFLLGALWGTALFLIAWVLPGIGINPVITMGLLILSTAALAFMLLRMTGNGSSWDGRHRVALAAGVLGFLIAIALVQELNGVFGMAVVGLLFAIGLLGMFTWQKKDDAADKIPGSMP